MNWYEKFERNEDYNQIVTWKGTTMKPDQVREFCEWMVQSTLVTQYPKVIGNVEDSKGLFHLLFFIHSADISRFALKRFSNGFAGEMSWYEDAINNGYEFPIDFLKVYPRGW